ncbi:hypothetical protein O9G_002920 [Rozella allomycis CSF55]|uniref:Uncharacterized protein n=1 Tax=Rozella allomycis (strain CSF55) TaxID=988480 RepID=A0A075B1K1_ROZAC|nr:hypothetical protein O9G_002920 [Rozella allomycis CSF55]|eukprot:EPZ36418.1 hypothetical protein O9G_002920 [Rozella allomycis CSF55]
MAAETCVTEFFITFCSKYLKLKFALSKPKKLLVGLASDSPPNDGKRKGTNRRKQHNIDNAVTGGTRHDDETSGSEGPNVSAIP